MPIAFAIDGGGTPPDDFRFGANPLVIFDFVDIGFSATSFRTGFDYTVPASRRCVIERVDVVTRVDATLTGTIIVSQDFIPSAGGSNLLRIMDLMAGDGPGVVSLLGLRFGHMLEGDNLKVTLSATGAGSGGTFRSALHGIEYDD